MAPTTGNRLKKPTTTGKKSLGLIFRVPKQIHKSKELDKDTYKGILEENQQDTADKTDTPAKLLLPSKEKEGFGGPDH